MEKKGTVTPLSSVFPADEALKASKHVQDAIAERKQQLEQVKGFVNDNISLINLVQKLPDETHHNIMVPFGKVAFFPGRLIHTNEFMVLLGEGYYAERTSKQTIEILKRRGRTLETQIDSLKAIMQDLNVEVSFFDATAQESVEGLVEIREDYVEEGSSVTSKTTGYKKSVPNPDLKADDRKATTVDEEFERIFSRMDELEKEEEAEKANESDEDKLIQDKPDSAVAQISVDKKVRFSPVEASEVPAATKVSDGSSPTNYPALKSSMVSKSKEQPQEKKKVQAAATTSNMAFTSLIVERPLTIGTNLPEQWTGTIGTNMPEQQTGARSSKPISRFKMQRK